MEFLPPTGFGDEGIQDMRHFAWLTAGWLNFEKMLWDWCSLDETDIARAIEWQRKDGLVDKVTAANMFEYANKRSRASTHGTGASTE
jgi:hypothetical protein